MLKFSKIAGKSAQKVPKKFSRENHGNSRDFPGFSRELPGMSTAVSVKVFIYLYATSLFGIIDIGAIIKMALFNNNKRGVICLELMDKQMFNQQ